MLRDAVQLARVFSVLLKLRDLKTKEAIRENIWFKVSFHY